MSTTSVSMCLGDFQRAFTDALRSTAPTGASALACLVQQPAFAVYRNTVAKGCIDALEANYPTVTRLVGREWFRAAAAVYVAESPPDDGRLLFYGDGFADFLRDFGPAAALPYLHATARLDRFWTEAHTAADAAVADGSEIAQLAPDALACCVLRPHPSARWAWFGEQPIFSIWRNNRAADAHTTDLVWRAEGALLTRQNDAVVWCELGAADCAFLDSCAQGKPLAAAAQAALTLQPDIDLSHVMARLLQAGALQAPAHCTES